MKKPVQDPRSVGLAMTNGSQTSSVKGLPWWLDTTLPHEEGSGGRRADPPAALVLEHYYRQVNPLTLSQCIGDLDI